MQSLKASLERIKPITKHTRTKTNTHERNAANIKYNTKQNSQCLMPSQYACMLSPMWLWNSMDCSPLGFSSLSMELSRQEYWSGLPFSTRDIPNTDQTHVSCTSWTGRWILYHRASKSNITIKKDTERVREMLSQPKEIFLKMTVRVELTQL